LPEACIIASTNFNPIVRGFLIKLAIYHVEELTVELKLVGAGLSTVCGPPM
jgi:hypothetical protein